MIQNITEIFALLLMIPAFITAFLILKEFRIRNIRRASYYKLFLLQTFIHTLFLVLAAFFAGFKTAFLVHSFGMLPLYALLLLRLYNLNNSWHANTNYLMRTKLQNSKPKNPKISPQRIKAMKVLMKRKSQWR